MADEVKKPEEEKPQAEEPAKTEEPKPTAETSEEQTEQETPETSESTQEPKAEEVKPPQLSKEDELKAENFRLKTQLEAMKIGFMPDVIEDAVVLAENIVKRDGSDITTALQTVAKKYPDWKADSKQSKGNKGGFKIGADSNADESNATDERLDEAFGIKRKRKE